MEENGASQSLAEIKPDGSFGDDAIRQQLGRIVTSSEFHATEKMRDFLRFVVEEKLAGRSHRLKGYTIAIEVFGRGEDFDATYDPVVRIQAGRLRRAIERYYLVAGVRDPILIEVPKGGYVPCFSVRPLSPQLERDPSICADRSPSEWPQGPSVAVLPFENLTGDPEQRALTDGLTEEMITEMTRFQDIMVIACQSAWMPENLPSEPTELGQAVGARFLLQGSVRRDKKSVKVTAHLTDTAKRRRIWADSYTLPLEVGQLIATQEEIASRVVGLIASEYGIISRRLSAESRLKHPTELGTYEAMLRYYSHQIEPSPDSAETCFAALKAAAETEPDYGPVWSALATLHCQMYSFGVPGVEDALATALEYARKGVSLEPASQLCRLILAYASYLAEDTPCFQQESEIALNLNPNSPYTVGAIGYIRVLRGEVDHGLRLLERAMAVSPCHPAWFHAGNVIDLLLRKDYGSSMLEIQRFKPFMAFWNDAILAAVLARLGRMDEARRHVGRVLEIKPNFLAHSRELFRRSLKIEMLVDDLVDGLHLAALPVASTHV